jgi:hypothetical protein
VCDGLAFGVRKPRGGNELVADFEGFDPIERPPFMCGQIAVECGQFGIWVLIADSDPDE